MHQHGEQSKTTHDILMLSTVKNLKEQGNQKDLEIMKLKKTNANTNETLSELKRDFTNLQDKFKKMTKQIETKEDEAKQLLNEINNNQSIKSQQLIKNIDDLKVFAKQTSRLHHALSDKLLRRNCHYDNTLFQGYYDEDENVKKWNEMVHEINEDGNECSYLKTLKSSVNRYKQTIYSTTYEERLKNFCYTVPLGESRNCFIRIGCSRMRTGSICVKYFNNMDDFQYDIEKDDRRRTLKVQHDYFICSYYIGGCLHVSFWFLYNNHYKIYLLHKSNEGETLRFQNGKEVNIYDIQNYRICNSIVLYIPWL